MRVRFLVLGLLVLLSVITYMDRICIAVAAPRIRKEFDIPAERWGWVMGAFVLSYGLFEIPSGAWGDRFGQRHVLTRIVVWWSAFTALTGMASNFWWLIGTRFLFGAGEAGAYPNAAGSVGRWFPAVERARAQGMIWGASRIGGALTPVVVVPLVATVGWRCTFYIFGGMGLVWSTVWWNWYRDHPADHPRVAARELAEIGEDGRGPGHAGVPWRLIFCNPRLWLIMAMYSCYVWGTTFYIMWLPEYLTVGRGFTEQEMAVFAALPFVMGACGNVAGGVLSDRLTKARGALIGRRLVGAGCLAASAFCLFATAVVPNRFAAVALLGLGFGIMDGMLPCAWALCLDIGGRYAGAISGAMNSAGQAGSFVCTVLFGYLVKWYGDYEAPLIVIACMVLASALMFYRIDPVRPLLLEEPKPAIGKE
jgi:MFS family permease